MFNTKYTVSILDSKWQVMKRNLKLKVIPRKEEFIYLNNQYYEVLNIVHMLNTKQDIFVIVNEFSPQPNNIYKSDNQ